MGGLPSRLWGEVIDELSERGVCICAAAGNHVGSSPPRVLVYPARYPRVIAVCGVMADGRPYADLDGVLEGSFGPASVMGQAIAAYTPNIPWPQYGCRGGVRLNGEGTSAATPQVAAAAALWLECHKQRLPRDWRRVEAAWHALFPPPGGAMPSTSATASSKREQIDAFNEQLRIDVDRLQLLNLFSREEGFQVGVVELRESLRGRSGQDGLQC